jgi:hypothetical protein
MKALFFSAFLLSMMAFSLIMPAAKSKPVVQSSADSPNLGIVSISASKSVVGRGCRLSLGINVTNYWNETETFNATFYANSTLIQEISNISVEGQNSTVVSFKWTTTGFSYGNYSISASITAAPNETDLSDNSIGDIGVFVTIVGDINGDRWVDLYDAIILSGIFGRALEPHIMIYPWYPPVGPFDANADFDDDGTIDIYEAIILAGHFGQHWT